MKFTQREIIDIKKIIADLKVPMFFKLDEDDIDLDFANNKFIQSILKRNNKGFSIYYTDSNGTDIGCSTENWEEFKEVISNWIEGVKIDNPYEIERKKNIQDLSENFYDIFQEAEIIKALGFIDTSGMVFRKALEVLVKDFLKNYLPEEGYSDVIIGKTIGAIILFFYEKEGDELIIRNKPEFSGITDELNQIKNLAKIINNTFKIGNDFSHYERRLVDFSPEDMRINIMKIMEFIDNQKDVEKFKNNLSEQNEDFEKVQLLK